MTTGHGSTINAEAAERAWSNKDTSEIQKQAIMKAVLESLVTWIDTANGPDVVKLKDNLSHIGKVDQLYFDAVFAKFPSYKPTPPT